MKRSLSTGKVLLLLGIAAFSTGGACPSQSQSLLDDLKSALDHCSPVIDPASLTTFCQTAVEKGEELIAESPTDVNARILLSNAYFGRAGLGFLDLLETFADLANTTANDYAEIRDAIQGLTVDLDDLRSSVSTLTNLVDSEGLTAEGNDDLFRQLGLVRALEAFVRPVQQAGAEAANVDANIDAAEAATIASDFLNSDNDLVDTDVDDADVLSPIRENYCRCSLQTGGFTAACLRDLMRCELSSAATDTNTDNLGIEQDYDGDGDADDVDCTTLLTPTGLSACGGRNTT